MLPFIKRDVPNLSQILTLFSTGTAGAYVECGGVCYVDFVYNLLLFAMVKEF